MTEPEKQCSKCLAFKPLGEFSNHKTSKGGKRANCKCCASEAQRKRRAANLEKYRVRERQYCAANSEKINECRRQRRAANPEKINEAQRQCYAANPEKINEARRQYSAANREKINEYARQYRAANPEKINEAQRKHDAAERHARNQCAIINALDPKKWELLRSKLKAMDSTKTKEKE